MHDLRLTQISATLDKKLGGPTSVVLDTHDFFLDRFFNYTLLVFGETTLIEANSFKAPTLFRNRFALLNNPLNLTFIRKLRKSDVILLHGYYLFSTIYSLLFYKGDRIFLMPHGTFEFYQQKKHKIRKLVFGLFLNVFLRSREIHFLVASEAEVPSLKAKFPKNSVTVVGIGVNLQKLNLNESRNENEIRLIFMGRIAEKKRIDLCMQAVKTLKLMGYKICFEIVGTGDEFLIQFLKNLVKELEIEDSVHFLGHLENEELYRVLALSHIFILPSENENFAIAVAESIGASVPVIVSKNVAMHNFVSKYKVGITIDNLESNLIVNAILDLLDNYSQFRDNCIKNRSLLDWSSVFVQWEEVLVRKKAVS